MSKNVAVFVDVANIFYAAKAAGVDIDYVTLLRSATAGRDFVRAYAYTGLDPENENQRQFHSFLTRSGYKVISKDIRKYGDGRIKANLDIELVVDMMRMAQHIDIAVVVSGDGDFAPAIRAVQQLGVRCEVISFRGNTSSDLIDVADVFTDITQIARVEKGARSGRRVAAEGDLSMTAVPEKETEGLTRRRRGRRPDRDEREEQDQRDEREEREERAGGEAMPGNLIVLPGERLSRAGAGEPDEMAETDEELVENGTVEATDRPAELQETDADGRRRRRRRGGRGRGRGRPQEGEVRPVEIAGEPIIEDEEFLEDEIAPSPQHSTFGSVWDSQLGVMPSVPTAASGGDEEEYEDEPEIPEYLLAERRQRSARGGRGMRPGGNRRAGYQSAVDRERYGRSGTPTFGGAGGNRIDRGRPQGNRGPRPPQQQQQQQRPMRPVYQEPMREPSRPMTQSATSSEPWSEVPPEVQEMLRAELARRQSHGTGSQGSGQRSFEPTRTEPSRDDTAASAGQLSAASSAGLAEAEPRPSGRGRSAPRGTRGATSPAAASSVVSEEVLAAAPEASPSGAPEQSAPAPARRTRRSSASPAASAEPAAEAAVAQAPGETSPAPATRGRPRRTGAAKTATTGDPATGEATDVAATTAAATTAASAPEAAPPTRRRTTRSRPAAEASAAPAAEASPAEASPAEASPAEATEAAPTTRRRSTRSRTAAVETEG